MIKLEVQSYCDDCLYFEANVERPELITMFADDGTQVKRTVGSVDTIVRCRNRFRCEHIKGHLKVECEKEIHQKIENDKKAKKSGKN